MEAELSALLFDACGDLDGWTYYEPEIGGEVKFLGPSGMALKFTVVSANSRSAVVEGEYPDGPDGEPWTPIQWGVVEHKQEIPRRAIILRGERRESIAGAIARFIADYEMIYNQCLAEQRLQGCQSVDTDETRERFLTLVGTRLIAERELSVRPNYAIEFAGVGTHFRHGEIHRSYDGEFQIDLFAAHPGFVEQLLNFLFSLEERDGQKTS